MGAVCLSKNRKITQKRRGKKAIRQQSCPAVCPEEARGGSKNVVALLIPQLSYSHESFSPFAFSSAIIAFGVFSLPLPLEITASGGPESSFSLAIRAFGAFEFIVPEYDYHL